MVNNIYDNPITVRGATLGLQNLLPHHQVAARVEADRTAVGAFDLDKAHPQVGRVDEGAVRQYRRKNLLDVRRPATDEGQFGVWLSLQQAVWLSPANHVRPGGSQIKMIKNSCRQLIW